MRIKMGLGLLLFVCAVAMYIFAGKISFLSNEVVYPNEKKLFSVMELLGKGNFVEAEKVLSSLVIRDGVSSETKSFVLYNLSRLLLSRAGKGDQTAAKDAFFCLKESLRIDPAFLCAKFNLEALLRSGAEQKSGQREEEQARPKGSSKKKKDSGEDKKKKEDKSLLPGLPPESISVI